ncbi:unnamed protein product [Dracunculus medinensis]|uniref:Secreted protein n=1 Tax=Dracunculus medinensis TaxID=318479 RepID=A0A0N4UCR9_DRAME|nr:unnamed protein product [Dracunculus medinensis]
MFMENIKAILIYISVIKAQLWPPPPYPIMVANPYINTMRHHNPYGGFSSNCITISRVPCRNSPAYNFIEMGQFPYNQQLPFVNREIDGNFNNLVATFMPNNMASLINPGLTWVNSALPFINAGTSSLLNSRQSIIDPKSIINRGSTINQGTTLTGDALQNIIDIYSRNSLLGQTGSNLLSGINKEKFQVQGCSFDTIQNSCTNGLNLCRGRCKDFGTDLLHDCRCIPDDLSSMLGHIKK